MYLLMSVVAIVVVLVASVNAQSACKTPVGEQGTCVPAKECSIIVNILMFTPKPLPPKALAYLESSHCGVQNSVYYACCSARHITSSNTTSKPPAVEVYKDTDNNQDSMQKDEMDGKPDMYVEYNNIDNHPNLKLLPLTQCGAGLRRNKVTILPQPEPVAYVVGGYFNPTRIGELPWNVLLQYQTPGGLKLQCGGALISSRYVLTAAHCVTGIDDTLVAVRVGEHNVSSEIDCEPIGFKEYCADPAEDIEIDEVVFHPQFVSRRFANDVALIRMKREVDITSDTVQAVCLPTTEELRRRVLTSVIVSGWGTTENNTPSIVLGKATMPILPNSRCQAVFSRSLNITNAQICAGGENMKDTCKGDSGGPLIENRQRHIQYGIISAGAPACGSKENLPGIYTKVSFYLKWILDQLKP